jgi:hypothetical protein
MVHNERVSQKKGQTKVFILKKFYMKKVIRLSESDLIKIVKKVLKEQSAEKKSIGDSLYLKIKNKPIVKKIESVYDPNPKVFVSNVLRLFPTFKKNESIILKKYENSIKNADDFLKDQEANINSFIDNKLQEQVNVGVIILGLIAVLVLIGLSKRNFETCVENKDATNNLQTLKGQTVNLYNDVNQQILYGRVLVNDISFQDCAIRGGRSHVLLNTEWRIECLSNPSRIGDTIDVVTRESVGKTVIKSVSSKYNQDFTKNVQSLVGSFCQKPSADFAKVNQTSNQNLV